MNTQKSFGKVHLKEKKQSSSYRFHLSPPFLLPLSFGGAKERGSLGVIETDMHPLFFLRILEELLRRTVEELTKRIHTFKPYGLRLVIKHAAYTLVAHPQLLEQPVFCSSLFLQQFLYPQTRHACPLLFLCLYSADCSFGNVVHNGSSFYEALIQSANLRFLIKNMKTKDWRKALDISKATSATS